MNTHRSRTKRLFLFAGYNAHGRIDAALVYYVAALSKIGDVVLIMDSDIPPAEMKKITAYVKYAHAVRHGEYDFGSYKRAYEYAHSNIDMSIYDFVYMVNDSVYGPLYPLEPTCEQMESFDASAFGLVCNPKHAHPHIQSWFIGMRPDVFLSQWFHEFITSVKKLESKGMVTYMYEHRFSALVREHAMKWQCIWTVKNRGVYNMVKKMYRNGMPFIKKLSFSRHGGALGAQIAYVLRHTTPDTRDAIMSGAIDTYGEKYVQWLMTRNPIKIWYRSIAYAMHKILGGKI